MPYLKIASNVDINDNGKQDVLLAVSRAVAQGLGKNEKYVMVSYEPPRPMCFGGSQEPCVYMELKSIGLPVGKTKNLSQSLCILIEQHLGVPPDRVYIEFSSAEGAMWGWNSGTF